MAEKVFLSGTFTTSGSTNGFKQANEDVDASFLTPGESYFVSMEIDGNIIEGEYLCKEVDFYGYNIILLGNGLYEAMEDTGEPFGLMYLAANNYHELYWKADTSDPVSFTITESKTSEPEEPTETISAAKKFLLRQIFPDIIARALIGGGGDNPVQGALLSSDWYTLTDANGLYRIPKEG